MDSMSAEMNRLIGAKDQRRHRLAAMTFPEKVRAVVKLQEMTAPLLRKQGRQVRVWTMDKTLLPGA